MLAHSVFFYFFSVIAIFSSLMVIKSRSTVNSVFFLILDFISVGCLFIMVGAEFLGMIILIVYVGAVAVLFLFVVMMLNVAEQKQSWFIGKKSTHIPTGLIVSVLIFLELLGVVGGWKQKDNLMTSSTLEISNISNFKNLLKNDPNPRKYTKKLERNYFLQISNYQIYSAIYQIFQTHIR